MSDDVEPVTLTYHPAGRAARREVFKPREGDGPDYLRFEQVRAHDGTWRTVGTELVDSVAIGCGE